MSPSTDFEVKPLPATFGAVVTGLVPERLDAAGLSWEAFLVDDGSTPRASNGCIRPGSSTRC